MSRCPARVVALLAWPLFVVFVPVAARAQSGPPPTDEGLRHAVRDLGAGRQGWQRGWSALQTRDSAGASLVPWLVEQLSDDHEDARWCAASALWIVGQRRDYASSLGAARVPLATAAADGSARVRAAAARALAQFDSLSPEALSALARTLRDTDPSVRGAAAEAVRCGSASRPELSQALQDALRHDADVTVRRAAAGSFAIVPKNGSVASSLAALHDPDREVVETVLESLWLTSDDQFAAVRSEVISGRAELTRLLDAPAPLIRARGAGLLARLAPNGSMPAVAMLMFVLTDYDPSRMAIDAARQAIQRWVAPTIAVEELQRALDVPRPQGRYEALTTLGHFGAAAHSALPAALRLLRDPDPSVREAAAGLVAAIGPEPSSLDDLMAAWDAQPDNRETLASAIGKLGPGAAAAVPRLSRHVTDALQGTPRWNRCSVNDAIEALGDIGSPAAIPALFAALRDARSLCVDPAIEALSKLGSAATTSLATLHDIAKDQGAPVERRILACEGLAAIGGAGQLDPGCIPEALMAPADSLRLRGARLAEVSGRAAATSAPLAARLLVRVASRSKPNEALASRLCAALGAMGTSTPSTEAALRTAGESPLPALRSAARAALETLRGVPFMHDLPAALETSSPLSTDSARRDLDVQETVLKWLIAHRDLPDRGVACLRPLAGTPGSGGLIPPALADRLSDLRARLVVASSCVTGTQGTWIDDATGVVGTMFSIGTVAWRDDTHAVVRGEHYDGPLAAAGADYEVEWIDGRCRIVGATNRSFS